MIIIYFVILEYPKYSRRIRSRRISAAKRPVWASQSPVDQGECASEDRGYRRVGDSIERHIRSTTQSDIHQISEWADAPRVARYPSILPTGTLFRLLNF